MMVLSRNLVGRIRKNTTAVVSVETRTECHQDTYANVAVTPTCLGLSQTEPEYVYWVLLALIWVQWQFLDHGSESSGPIILPD
jgi:hypothetical protein